MWYGKWMHKVGVPFVHETVAWKINLKIPNTLLRILILAKFTNQRFCSWGMIYGQYSYELFLATDIPGIKRQPLLSPLISIHPLAIHHGKKVILMPIASVSLTTKCIMAWWHHVA